MFYKAAKQADRGVEKGRDMFRTFTRTWWKCNPSWPDGREPHVGRRHYLPNGRYATETEARERCRLFNSLHKPGFLSLKAEYESTVVRS